MTCDNKSTELMLADYGINFKPEVYNAVESKGESILFESDFDANVLLPVFLPTATPREWYKFVSVIQYYKALL